MTGDVNPLAIHHLPSFITAPGQTDWLLVGIGVFLLIIVIILGISFLWLHSLPERMAHKNHKIQFEIVAVLCLLALFTHNNLLWGIALLLAMLDLPDIVSPLDRISASLQRMTDGRKSTVESSPPTDEPASSDPEGFDKTTSKVEGSHA